MGFGEVGLQRDGFAEALQGSVRLFQRLLSKATVRLGCCVVGEDPNGFVYERDGLLGVAGL